MANWWEVGEVVQPAQSGPKAAPAWGAGAMELPDGSIVRYGPRGGATVLKGPSRSVGGDPRGLSDALSTQEKKSLDEARDAANNAISTMDTLTEFQNINEGRGVKRQATGGGPFGIAWRFVNQPFDSELQRLNALTATIAPSKRQPGSGTTSDKDLALYLKGTPSIYKNEETNLAIIEDGRREAIRRQQRATFLDNYARQHGTLNGADEAFRREVGAGTKASPLSAQEAGDRSTLPRGTYYYDPQGNLRRNDNGSRGNPIIEFAKPGGARPQSTAPRQQTKTPTGASVSDW